jgi:hypothetical protein
MRADNGDIPPGEQVLLLQELQNLLEKQIALANQGNIKDVEAMARQASSLAERITDKGVLERPEFKIRREQLQKLYAQLSLAISAQRAETGEQLIQIRKGKKLIESYRKNISL